MEGGCRAPEEARNVKLQASIVMLKSNCRFLSWTSFSCVNCNDVVYVDYHLSNEYYVRLFMSYLLDQETSVLFLSIR